MSDEPEPDDEPEAPPRPTFLVTKEYRRFAEFCDACRRERYIGLCYGPPGVGKTLSARHYARWEALGPVVERRSFWHDIPSRPDLAECRTILFSPSVTATPKRVDDELRNLRHRLHTIIEEALYPDEPPPGISFDDRWTELIIVDEADRLNFPSLEQLRDVYDRTIAGKLKGALRSLSKRRRTDLLAPIEELRLAVTGTRLDAMAARLIVITKDASPPAAVTTWFDEWWDAAMAECREAKINLLGNKYADPNALSAAEYKASIELNFASLSPDDQYLHLGRKWDMAQYMGVTIKKKPRHCWLQFQGGIRHL
jgi:hypothetical protein